MSELRVRADPLSWRPQRARPARVARAVEDAILEPLWNGLHILVHFDTSASVRSAADGWVRLMDQDGNDVTFSEPDVVQELGRAVMAQDAVLDGYLTDQATRSGEGDALSLRANVSKLQPILPGRADVELGPTEDELVRPSGTPVAFVAVDLLRVDGEDLLDVPLLERKRLLEGVIAASDLVRVTPFARPPIGQWLASWKSAGFAGLVAKAANSRYVPSSETEEWAVYTKLR